MNNEELVYFAEAQSIPYIVKRKRADETQYCDIIWPGKLDQIRFSRPHFKCDDYPQLMSQKVSYWSKWWLPKNYEMKVWGKSRFWPTVYPLPGNNPQHHPEWLVEGPSVPFSDPFLYPTHLLRLAKAWEFPTLVIRPPDGHPSHFRYGLIYPGHNGHRPRYTPLTANQATDFEQGWSTVHVSRPIIIGVAPWLAQEEPLKAGDFRSLGEQMDAGRAQAGAGEAPVTEKGKAANRYELEGGLESMDTIAAFGWEVGFIGGSILKRLARIRNAYNYGEATPEDIEIANVDIRKIHQELDILRHLINGDPWDGPLDDDE